MLFFILSLTTLPTLVLRRPRAAVGVACSVISFYSCFSSFRFARCALTAAIFVQNCFDARHVAAHIAQAQRIVQLTRRMLKTEILILLRQIFQPVLQLRWRQLCNLIHSHLPSLSQCA